MSTFKKVLTVAFSMALLVLAVACKPTPFGRIGDFEPESNKLYVKYLYVSYSGEDGFADDDENLFVYYPGANKKFHSANTVRVVFYGRNFRTEDKKIEITNEYGTYEKVYTHVISKVKTPDIRVPNWENRSTVNQSFTCIPRPRPSVRSRWISKAN